jgi:polysaccharide deacetylase 2 family uncharacterized protein YibQ
MKALTITASVVFAVLVAAIAFFAFFPGESVSDPSVTVAVSAPPPKPAPPRAPAAPQINLPPGFGIAGPQQQGAPPAALPQSAPGSPNAAPQQQAGVGQQGGEVKQTATLSGPAPPQGSPPIPGPPESESVPIRLVNVPVEGLVEESVYGPLPKVAQNGARPIDIYARPSRYAAKATANESPRIAVLVNGMGLSDGVTADAIKGLPPQISVAYGAYGRNLQDWVQKARDDGHEVLLQIPLEPEDYPQNDPGPHTLLTTLPPEENIKRLQWLMSRFTGYVGITNQMGARFEQNQASLAPVLEELKARGLLFVDDGTSPNSTAPQVAGALGLDFAVADVQIDALPSPSDIAKALAKLETLAKEQGSAIGVASAKPATVKQLTAWAEQLFGKGIVLIPVSAAVRSQRPS